MRGGEGEYRAFISLLLAEGTLVALRMAEVVAAGGVAGVGRRGWRGSWRRSGVASTGDVVQEGVMVVRGRALDSIISKRQRGRE